MTSSGAFPTHVERYAIPTLLGYLLNWGLHGALSVQVYDYYLGFPNDKPSVKALVYGVYLVEVAQTILTTYDAFVIFGAENHAIVTKMELSWISAPVLGAIVAFIGQSFYAHRIYLLSRSRALGLLIFLIALAQLATGITAGVQAFEAGDVSLLRVDAAIFTIFWTGSSALCDVVIAVTMTFILMRRKSTVPTTQVLIIKIVRLTVETGAVTATMAMATLVLFAAFPDQIYFTAVAGTIPKWYSNTLLVLLNSRARISRGSDLGEADRRNTSVWFIAPGGGDRVTMDRITYPNHRGGAPTTPPLNRISIPSDQISLRKMKDNAPHWGSGHSDFSVSVIS